MEYYFRFGEINDEDGSFYETDVEFPSLMRKHIQKHGTVLQPLYEAISNSFEATKDEKDSITIAMNFSRSGVGGVRDLLSVSVKDTGHGITRKDLIRLKRLYDESKGYNNLGSGRVQYLHFFNRTDIHTVYNEDGRTFAQRFVMSIGFFEKQHSVLWMGKPEEVEEGTPTGTTVTFSLLRDDKDKKEYDELSAEKLKETVWNHYLGRLCLHVPHCPNIYFREYVMEVEDESAVRSITNDDIPKHEYSIPFKVKFTKYTRTGQYVKTSKTADFTLQSFKLPVKTQRSNEVKVIQDVDIRDLVYAKDIIYREAPLENYDGRIVYGKRGKALITVNSNLTYVPRKRFTVAHELGHFILGHNRKEVIHDNEASMEFYKSGSLETEANQFASELLMPTSIFLEYIDGERFSPQLMHDLAGEFKTSVTSVVYKYLECGSHPIAVFYSYNNKIRYWKKSADYLRWPIDLKNLPVPHNSVAEEWYLKGEQYEANDIQKIDLNVWFNLRESDNNWGYEYCLVSPKYNTVLSIVWED